MEPVVEYLRSARNRLWMKVVGERRGRLSIPIPRRTREHIIASLSVNFVERFFLENGHTVHKVDDDYGYDLVVTTYDLANQGAVEASSIYLQLKATDASDLFDADGVHTFPLQMKHYNQWTKEPLPVFVILYHAPTSKAYWQYLQGHVASGNAPRPKPGAKSIGLKIPASNEFNHSTVNYARERKQAILDQLQGKIRHELN